jgi:hypothetical protein
MSTRNLPGGKGLPALKADNLTSICEPMWEPRRLTTLLASTACYRDSFTFAFYILILKCWTNLKAEDVIMPCLVNITIAYLRQTAIDGHETMME